QARPPNPGRGYGTTEVRGNDAASCRLHESLLRSGAVEWRRREQIVGNHTAELAALQQLAPLAAAPGHLVFRGADRLLGAAGGLDAHQIAVALRRHEANHLVLVADQLDQ